jgi:hypothetical protein
LGESNQGWRERRRWASACVLSGITVRHLFVATIDTQSSSQVGETTRKESEKQLFELLASNARSRVGTTAERRLWLRSLGTLSLKQNMSE